MSKASYPLKLPASIKAAAARLAKEGWRVAQPVDFGGDCAEDRRGRNCRRFHRRAGNARPMDILPFLDKAGRETPPVGDEI
jgi:hypothetical protein